MTKMGANYMISSDPLDWMREAIEETLRAKTGKSWIVTYEVERLDFQFIATTDIGNEKYVVRSASYDAIDLSKTAIPLMVARTAQTMLAHYNKAKKRQYRQWK